MDDGLKLSNECLDNEECEHDFTGCVGAGGVCNKCGVFFCFK